MERSSELSPHPVGGKPFAFTGGGERFCETSWWFNPRVDSSEISEVNQAEKEEEGGASKEEGHHCLYAQQAAALSVDTFVIK